MTLFSWLFLAHLLGDWVLQNDWMARNKQNALFTRAGLLHYLIYTATIAGLLAVSHWVTSPISTAAAGFFLLLTFLSHWVIDAKDLAGCWMRLMQQTPNPLVHTMVDQTFHLVLLAALTQLLLR